MTWFLNDAAPDAPQPLEGAVPTGRQQFVGSAKDLWSRQDTWNEVQGYRDDLVNEMMKSVAGNDRNPDWLKPRTRDEIIEYSSPFRRGHYIARRIGEMKKGDPQGTLAHLPGSPEEFDAEWKSRRKKDFDENRAMLDRGDSAVAKGAGEMFGAVADPVNMALAPFGLGMANAGRFIMAEAALGAAAEIPGTIAEHEQASELGFTPENPLVRIGTGAAASGALAGVMVGGARVLTYGRARMAGEAASRPADVSGADYEDAITGAEADLRAGREPAPAAPYKPNINMPADQDPAVINLTRMIGGLEAPKGFNQVYGGTMVAPPRQLTTMTINQVLDWQARSVAAGSKSSAAGRFQIIQGTLKSARDALGLTGDELFDEATQTRLAIHLMKGRGLDDWRAGRISTDQFMDNMAQEWAALPRATGPNAGRSHYDGDGLNNALIGLDDARAIFGGQHADGISPRASGGASGPGYFPQPRRLDWFDEVTTPGGMSVDVRYRVVDLDSLQRASGDLQPRDRSRAASDEQIAGIARNLDPARLLPSPESASGAPIVGPDMMVESGNGRIAALNRAADEHPDRYQAYVRAIEDAGFQVPEGVSRPALVAERVTDLDFEGRRRFVRESNTSSIGRMSATEQAGVDADYLSQAAFDGYRPGRGLNGPENAEFVRRVFAAMPQAERAGLMTADGRLNIDGLRRLRQALFARAFGAEDLLKLLAETEHPAVEGLLRMLEDLAPDWAAFRAAVDAGYIRPEFDITDPLMDAVRAIARARIDPRDGQSVIAALRDKLAQGDLFATRDPELTEAIIGAFYKGDRARGPDATQNILARYMTEAELAGRADIADMFAADAGLTPTTVLREATAAQDARAPMPARGDSPYASLEGASGGHPDIRALDSLDTAQGAHSPALLRATDAELRELREGANRVETLDPPEGTGGGVDMIRPAVTLGEAKAAAKEFLGKSLTNEATGMIATVSGKSLNKMTSLSAYSQSSSVGLHAATVANADTLFQRASHGWQKADRAGDTNVPYIHRFFVPINTPGGRMGMAKLTVKEIATAGDVNRIYTVEAVETAEGASAVTWTAAAIKADGIDPISVRPAEAVQNMARQVDDFNAAHDAIAKARAAIEAEPDLTLRMGAGQDAREVSLADLLDDLDRDDALVRSMTSCSLKGTPK